MGCCPCCCENASQPGVCCGAEGYKTCCKRPRQCCGETCCPEGECCVGGTCVPCECDPACGPCEQCTEVTEGVFECVSYCAAGEVCCDGVCKECCNDADCPEGQTCVDGTCQPACDPPCTGCSECVSGNCVTACAAGENCCNGVCQSAPCDCTPECDRCSDCVDGDCLSSCATGQNCCNGACQDAPCPECVNDADCTPPAGAVAQCCSGVCKNTQDDIGYCRDADTGNCYSATYDDCTRANQSNTFDLCACPPGPLSMFSAGLVGTELKKILARFGFVASTTCSCNKRAKIMDERGVVWCQQNIPTIVEWLQEEAAKRTKKKWRRPAVRLMVSVSGPILVRWAIRSAKKANSQ